MAQRLAELCIILVESAYGELAAQIFSILAVHGRSSLMDLHLMTHMSFRRIKTALATLVQHHILFHSSVDEESPTYFQADWSTAYTLVRSHKITTLVAQQEGEAAGQLVADILQLGHVSIGDLADSYDLTSASKRDSGIVTAEEHMTESGMINGFAKEGKHKTQLHKITTIPEFHETLRTLLDNEHLIKVGERSYLAQADYYERLQDETIRKNARFANGKITGPKTEKAFKDAVNQLKRKWDDEECYSQTKDIASCGVIKRSKASPSSSKRIKLNGDLPNGFHHLSEDEDEETEHCVPKLPNDLVVRVNPTKYSKMLHSQLLDGMVDRFLGPVAAKVHGALMSSLEDPSPPMPVSDKKKVDEDDCDEEDEDAGLPYAYDMKVLNNLDKSIDLASSIKSTTSNHKLPNGVGKHSNKPKVLSDDPDDAELGIKVEQASDDEGEEGDELPVNGYASVKERRKRLHLLGMHLDVLAEHPKSFCIRPPGEKESRINAAALTRALINLELDVMIHARYGKLAIRAVRMVRKKGKLDEKQISDECMIGLKEARALLTYLQFEGILDAQEIPKDNSRQPSRTMYLWFFDDLQLANQYLQQTYHAMSRTLQRIEVERNGKYKAVIEKAERSDVKGREQELLGYQEKELLKEWREVEEELLTQISRMDDVVALLREFSGTDTSLST